MLPQNLVLTENVSESLKEFFDQIRFSKVAVLVDENSAKFCLPDISERIPSDAVIITIDSGEFYKNIETCTKIWSHLSENMVDRNGVLINLGGGVICDMGGFCAATYLRGIKFINIPTTLLSMVDASCGGKLGIDFQGIKNQIGLFQESEKVIVDPRFLKTLPESELKSGFAEIIKHSLIADVSYYKVIASKSFDSQPWRQHIVNSIKIKYNVVRQDPIEKGYRKILNFGHTVGHAVESHFLNSNNKLLHGEAVALGMICELYLSYKILGFKSNVNEEVAQFIFSIFPKVHYHNEDIESIIKIAKKDKKNINDEINAVLLKDIGFPEIDCLISINDLRESLLYYLETK